MSQALYRKWRPHLWEQVVGQDHVVQTLQNAIRAGRIGHAYLFAGPRGTGKTTTARLLAKAVNCLSEDLSVRPCDRCAHCQAVNDGRFLDLIEIDAASNTSVDDVRDLRDKINFSPNQGRYKVYIIDEVHMLSTAAFNALLKTLEEPPAHAIFILATTEVHKIPATVLSRCQQHEFRRIPVAVIIRHLKQLCDQENLPVEEEALSLIARQATGSLRDAISLLDQLASSGQPINLEMAQRVLGTATNLMVVELIDAIQHQDSSRGLNSIHQALDSGSDPRQFARQVVEYLRNLLLVRMGAGEGLELTPEQRQQMVKYAQFFETPRLMAILRHFNSAASDLRAGWQPGLLLELALADSLLVSQAPAAQTAARAAVADLPAQQVTRVASVSKTEHNPPPAQVSERAAAAEGASKNASADSAEAAEREAVKGVTAHQDVPEGTISLPAILKNWDRIREQVKLHNRSTVALLNSCKSITMRENVLQLGFASELLKGKMEKDDNIKITSKVIKEILGAEVPIACTVVGARGGALHQDVDADGMVSAALNLGGKIVHKE